MIYFDSESIMKRVLMVIEDKKAKQVSEECDVSESAVRNWKNGKTAITIDALYKMCIAYDISADWILFNRRDW